MSSSRGGGALGGTSPIGQACSEAFGKVLLSLTGLKLTESFPTGRDTQP
jgi:hypothetical protein